LQGEADSAAGQRHPLTLSPQNVFLNPTMLPNQRRRAPRPPGSPPHVANPPTSAQYAGERRGKPRGPHLEGGVAHAAAGGLWQRILAAGDPSAVHVLARSGSGGAGGHPWRQTPRGHPRGRLPAVHLYDGGGRPHLQHPPALSAWFQSVSRALTDSSPPLLGRVALAPEARELRAPSVWCCSLGPPATAPLVKGAGRGGSQGGCARPCVPPPAPTPDACPSSRRARSRNRGTSCEQNGGRTRVCNVSGETGERVSEARPFGPLCVSPPWPAERERRADLREFVNSRVDGGFFDAF
jgi:hypothetical protein